MKNQISKIREELDGRLTTVTAADGLQIIESSFKKAVKELFGEMKNLSPEEKKEAGQLINGLKNDFEAKLKAVKEKLENATSVTAEMDLSIASGEFVRGKIHPLIRVGKMMEALFFVFMN